jgi:magnesium chelatase family protein
VRGVLPMVVAARDAGLTKVLLPRENAAEAALVGGMEILGACTLSEALAVARGEKKALPPEKRSAACTATDVDYSLVKGQEGAKRALEVAAAGGHLIII